MTNDIPLQVWFVNVGHGDCTIVKFPSGRLMMVDICNSDALDSHSDWELWGEASGADKSGWAQFMVDGKKVPDAVVAQYKRYASLLECPIDVFKRVCPGQSIFRLVLTHPDMDHMTGLHRLIYQEPSIPVWNFWDTEHNKPRPESFSAGQDERDWDAYENLRTGGAGISVHHKYIGATGNFWTEDGMTIMLPTRAGQEQACATQCWNNLSYMFRIVHGRSSLILPGDAETPMLDAIGEVYGDESLRSTILKAPHHGRESAYSEAFMKAVRPDYTVVSVGKKPETDASDKYRNFSRRVFSTRFQGTIHAKLWANGDVEIRNSTGVRIDLAAEQEKARVEAAMRSLMRGRA